MLTPTSGTIADYHSAILAGNPTHTRITFPVQSVVLTDDNISVDGGIQMTSIMNTEDDLVFGKAVSTEVKIFLLNGNVFSGFNWTEKFKLEFGVEISGTTNWVVVGWFKGTKPERTIRTDVIEFVAYDRMQAFDVLADEFLASVTYPVTMQTLFQNLCTYCGVGYAVGSEMADSMAVSYAEDPFADGITCRTLLAWIAEANCTVAKINADGDVVLAWYTDQTATYSIDENHYFDINISENTVSPIDCVDINSTDTEISGFIYPVGGTNPYHIIDNPLLMFLGAGVKATIITNMITRLSALANYIPTAVAAFGNWLVETGDIISVGYDNGSTMAMPVFNKVFMWAGAGEDTYECTGKAERTALTGSAKDDYVLGGKLSNKYTIVTGVDIDDDGIIVSGNKYVKILSGGILDVQSSNFELNSTSNYLKTKNWRMDKYGLSFIPDTWVQQGYDVIFSIADEPITLNDNPYKSKYEGGIYTNFGFFDDGQGNTDFSSTLTIFGRLPNKNPVPLNFTFNVNDKEIYIDADGTAKIDISDVSNIDVESITGGALDNYAKTIQLKSTDSTWAKIWDKIDELEAGESATFYCHGTPYGILSGGVRSSQCMGVIARYTSSSFQIFTRFTSDYGILAAITNASSSSAGTYTEGVYQKTGKLSSLNTSTKTDIVSAINEVNGKVLKDDIIYQASATTHAFTVANNSRNFVIFGGDGVSYTYIGYVYGNSSGGVTHIDLYTGSRIQAIRVQGNQISFTFSQASSCYLRSVNLRGNILSNA